MFSNWDLFVDLRAVKLPCHHRLLHGWLLNTCQMNNYLSKHSSHNADLLCTIATTLVAQSFKHTSHNVDLFCIAVPMLVAHIFIMLSCFVFLYKYWWHRDLNTQAITLSCFVPLYKIMKNNLSFVYGFFAYFSFYLFLTIL